jgi:hypothetical protein
MRVTILLVCCSFLAMIAGIESSSSLQTTGPKQPTVAEREAAALWEEAIEAKGGRVRLHGVTNIFESYSNKRFYELNVFPDKQWYWADDRPTPLGVYVRMINLDLDLSYDVHEWDSGMPVNKGKRNASEDPIVDIQLYYLLETQWVKPVPVRVYNASVGSKPVDIIQTMVNGHRYDFHLDKQSHLPLEVTFPWPQDSEGTNYGRGTIYATFADYAAVNGIQMPQKVGHMAKPDISQSIQLNVEYDASIFERPPSLKTGPDAWRFRKPQN